MANDDGPLTAAVPTTSLRTEPIDSAVGARLVTAQWREIMSRYGVEDVDVALDPLDPAHFREPEGTFVVVSVDGEPVGCGGLRPHPEPVPGLADAPTAEVKRMYVHPNRRGLGLSRLVLTELEERGRGLGYERLVLETGVLQPEAIGLYEATGWTRIANLGPRRDYDGLRCYLKAL